MQYLGQAFPNYVSTCLSKIELGIYPLYPLCLSAKSD